MPVIAIVIDDLGTVVPAAQRAIRLPKPVTLSFLPYPDATPALAREAEDTGHQVLVHVPMEPDGSDNPGPNALRTDLDTQHIQERLEWALDRVPGFSGVNNHMGSRFTADAAALVPVMETLAARHAFFLDSRTTPLSVGVFVARRLGVQSAPRDVFLDDDQSPAAIRAQLAHAEEIAAQKGLAIAIGHPHDTTFAVLEDWTAHTKGFVLVTAGEAIRLESERVAGR